MTQATVNVGTNAVKNLNPNAQLFSTSDYNNGTVLTGSTGPSDESFGDYLANGNGPYLQQHQSHLYQVDPSSIDTHHSQQQQQQVETNLVAHEHAAMLETMDHTQTSLLNPNHLHHPPTHLHQTMPDEEQVQQQQQQQQQQPPPQQQQLPPLQLTSEQLRQALRKQLEYYFSRENMANDTYLKAQMDADDYVPIITIANFKLVKRLTHDLQLIIDVLKELPSVEVDGEERKVRSTDDKRYAPIRKRCIIILRDVPLDATESEVSDLFVNEHCPVPAVSCERALESGTSDCWYVTFNSEDDAQNAFLYLTRENVSIRGQKVLARMKARLWQKPVSVPSTTNSARPISPSTLNNNGGATSPTPPTQSNSLPPTQQVPIQAYPNSTFIQQQGPIQYAPHPQTQQFNQQQQSQQTNQQQQQSQTQQQTQHQSVYNTHPNQSSILGNLQTQQTNFRHPMHSSVAPPQHLATQFSTANPSQHPTTLDHTQVLQQHIRMTYPNYATNPPFDRTTWSGPHPQAVQPNQSAISFATTAQQPNMQSYATSLHPQPQFITNHPVFPGNIWYVPSTYPPTEPYPTMAYNGSNKQKNRTPREYTMSSKSRGSTKPTGARNSRHEGIQMTSEHSNELLDYCQHSTPHSEGSSSPVPRAEAVINRPNESHVQNYPTDTSSTNDNVDQYQHQPTNDSLYNNSNSHLQQQGSTDTNSSQEILLSTQSSNENAKSNYQPMEQRKAFAVNQDSQPSNDSQSQQQQQQQQPQQQSNKKSNNQQIPPLMSRENRPNQNSNRSSNSSQQGRSQQQTRMNSNSSTSVSVNTPKVSSATYYNQTSSSSPQSPNTNQKTQQQQQQPVVDNSGPRTYADMLKLKQAPQQQGNDSTKSPPNESNDLSSSRAQSPNNPKTDSASANIETDGPLSSASSDISPSNPTEPTNPSQASSTNDLNAARRNSSASDHPQQQQQQQHTSSPSHQQYSNSRGRGGRGYRYPNNERRSGSNNSLNRGGGGGGGGRGGNRRSMNNNNPNSNTGANGPSGYQSRGGNRGNGRFYDRPRGGGGGGGNYHNSNQTVHRFTGNTGNVEPQVH